MKRPLSDAAGLGAGASLPSSKACARLPSSTGLAAGLGSGLGSGLASALGVGGLAFASDGMAASGCLATGLSAFLSEPGATISSLASRLARAGTCVGALAAGEGAGAGVDAARTGAEAAGGTAAGAASAGAEATDKGLTLLRSGIWMATSTATGRGWVSNTSGKPITATSTSTAAPIRRWRARRRRPSMLSTGPVELALVSAFEPGSRNLKKAMK